MGDSVFPSGAVKLKFGNAWVAQWIRMGLLWDCICISHLPWLRVHGCHPASISVDISTDAS